MQNKYETEVRRIAELLAMIEYKKAKWVLMTWEQLQEATVNPDYDFCGNDYYKDIKENLVCSKMEEAREMVSEMAKQFEAGYDIWLKHEHHSKGKKEILIIRGLVPEPKKEKNETL